MRTAAVRQLRLEAQISCAGGTQKVAVRSRCAPFVDGDSPFGVVVDEEQRDQRPTVATARPSRESSDDRRGPDRRAAKLHRWQRKHRRVRRIDAVDELLAVLAARPVSPGVIVFACADRRAVCDSRISVAPAGCGGEKQHRVRRREICGQPIRIGLRQPDLRTAAGPSRRSTSSALAGRSPDDRARSRRRPTRNNGPCPGTVVTTRRDFPPVRRFAAGRRRRGMPAPAHCRRASARDRLL